MLSKVKQTYTILNNALERAKVENGTDINNWYIPTKGSQGEKSMFFAEKYLLPYLQVVKYCKDNPEKPYCYSTYLTLSGDYKDYMVARDDSGTIFLLNNGVSVFLRVGEISTTDSGVEYDEKVSRVLITFDIDGPKGYNKKGYDVFMIELGGAEGPAKKNRADRNKFLPYQYDTSKPCNYYVSEITHACNRNATYGGSMCLAYIAVSYTHLDVYKRQLQLNALKVQSGWIFRFRLFLQ